jgi:hypothetical protein
MKRHLLRLISLAIFANLSAQTQAADPQSYPLFCKGSKDMKLEIFPGHREYQSAFQKGDTRSVTRPQQR